MCVFKVSLLSPTFTLLLIKTNYYFSPTVFVSILSTWWYPNFSVSNSLVKAQSLCLPFFIRIFESNIKKVSLHLFGAFLEGILGWLERKIPHYR